MDLEMTDCESPVSEDQIREVEIKYNFIFPEQFRKFILRYNGGSPEPSIFAYGSGPYSDSDIAWFLAIYDGKYENFSTYFETFKISEERIPKELVPIARDSGGNLICISISGESTGKVFFWDHEYELTPEEQSVFLISDSFDELLNSLKPIEEE